MTFNISLSAPKRFELVFETVEHEENYENYFLFAIASSVSDNF